MSNGTNAVQVEKSSAYGVQNYYPSGFQSTSQYHQFLQSVEDSADFPLNYCEPFLQTTNSEVLAAIGSSRFVAKRTREAIDKVLDPWTPDSIKDILKFLKHIPFELSNLIDNELGYALKSIKKTATLKNDTEIVAKSSKLINEWRELQTKSVNANGKRDSPERSSTSPPATEAKKIKLAIQKDPPVRPKAIADPNFFPTLGEQKKFRRPVYSVDTTMIESEPIVAPESPVVAAASTPITTNTTTNTTSSPTTNKKRVTFSEKLTEIRVYEKNPDEWTSFENQPPDEIDNYYSTNFPHLQKQPEIQTFFNIPSVAWYTPHELNFNVDENPSIVIPKLIRTPETFAQDNRENSALAAIYTSIQHIPSSPSEPDETPDPNVDTRVISLDDINNDGYNPPLPPPDQQQSLPQPQQSVIVATPAAPAPTVVSSPAINPNLISPATLSALAAVLKNPANNVSHQKTFQPQVVQQQQQQPAVYTPVPFATQQSEISNSTVESMLRNNPGIMNSLKQLSFLAGSNSPTPQTQSPITSDNYHLDSPPPTHYNNNSNNNRHTQQNFNGARRGKKSRSNRSCAYFKSAEGCRNGANCPYFHDQ